MMNCYSDLSISIEEQWDFWLRYGDILNKSDLCKNKALFS